MIGKKVTLSGLKTHLAGLRPERAIRTVIVHHFYRPTAAQWKGLTTLQSVQRFHTQQNGWSDIGYHIVIGPDDTIWLARPIEQAGAHCKGENEHSVGIAYAADFDTEDPSANGLSTGQSAVAAVCGHFAIPAHEVYFHRDFAQKTCPGTKLSREPYRAEVAKLLAPPKPDYIRLKIDGEFVWAADIHTENGKSVGFEGPIAKAIGAPCSDQRRIIVIRDYLAAHSIVIPADGWQPHLGPAGTILAVSKRNPI
jgi:hypothetical protein